MEKNQSLSENLLNKNRGKKKVTLYSLICIPSITRDYMNLEKGHEIAKAKIPII